MPPYTNPEFGPLLIEVMRDELRLGWATGFVVLSSVGPLLFTNRHVVSGTNLVTKENKGFPNRLNIRHHRNGEGGYVHTTEPVLGSDNTPLWYEHPELGECGDFVALRLTQLEGVQVHSYDLGNLLIQEDHNEAFEGILLEPTESVSIIGYPFGKSSASGLPIWVNGSLATRIDDDYLLYAEYREMPVFLVDSRTREGQSGSPVIAFRPGGVGYRPNKGTLAINSGAVGRLLGIYSGRINKESDLGVVWKAQAMTELLRHVEASVQDRKLADV